MVDEAYSFAVVEASSSKRFVFMESMVVVEN
jgi:hypothetical protein